ncbi:hypothetical protein TIFTF001_038129 [Ficus carica]|uniref:Uncharacterized protein n=1 Tax=Ficus carica TaxID=3494 RepID=A0AA88EB02_FICCA|nr:hypothetical protein TIFTF001_038129 [Ficus carica]
MKTDSDDLQFVPQDDGFLDSNIGDIADKGVKEDKDKEKEDKEEDEEEE